MAKHSPSSPAPQDTGTIAERIRLSFERLTRAERLLATTLLSNYPVAGLTNVSEVARAAGVSAPTVIRTVQKLGFAGFPEFQEELRAELAAQLSTPLAKHERWAVGAPDTHMLNRFAVAVVDNLERSLQLADHREFDAIVSLLADETRAIHVAGGRLTRVLAAYLATHLEGIRPAVHALPSAASRWPQCLLHMAPGDVLIVFDIRRYERDLVELAQIAARREVVVVLLTDQWMSPISAVARHALPLRIEAPSSADSLAVPLILVEALIAATAERIWPAASARMAVLEQLYEETRRFRK
ncbi:DNA-binding MurR/RpiR family transcriptional regulator [Rhodoligotrophos appendicifer]|uniref:MurR/RpiR family transcriptional regulator n=1 Tax=Rhodoligotrophos appendicifer TaxID=987056 RepID=UPI001185127B|nr:MurR/RpiR family transcriptional regulator [Rhodoligotrophos appendicifer]